MSDPLTDWYVQQKSNGLWYVLRITASKAKPLKCEKVGHKLERDARRAMMNELRERQRPPKGRKSNG